MTAVLESVLMPKKPWNKLKRDRDIEKEKQYRKKIKKERKENKCQKT